MRSGVIFQTVYLQKWQFFIKKGIQALWLPTLEYCRECADMIQVYKILHDIHKAHRENYSKWHLTHQHSLKLFKKRCRLNLRSTPSIEPKTVSQFQEQLLFTACDRSVERTVNKSCNSTLLKCLQKQILERSSLQIQSSRLPHGRWSQTGNQLRKASKEAS